MMVLPIVLIVSALAPNVSVLISAQLLAGVVSGVALPAIYASASAIAPPGRESKTLSIVLTGWMLSLVAGVSLSAILADLVNWRAVYGAVAILAILAALLVAQIKTATRPASKPAALPLVVLGLPGVKPLLVTGAAFLTAFYGVYGYLGDHLHRGLHLPVSINGLIALAYGLGFGSAVFVDHAVVRIGVRRALPLSVLLVASTYLLLALLSTTLAGVLLLLAALGLFNHLAINLLIVRLTSIDPTKRGSITGLYSAMANLAVFAGTSGFGPLYSSFGFAICAYGAAALSLAAALTATKNWGRSG
jgi:MFS transporter, DHA1 family, inner membrane transport protein